MKVLIVNHQEVQQWLSMSECVDAMAGVFKMLNRGNAVNPLRNLMWLPDKSGLIGMMPAYLEDGRVMGLKAISVFPGNHATEYDSHQGTVMLFETQNGRLLAMVDAGKITAIEPPPSAEWLPDYSPQRMRKTWRFWAPGCRPQRISAPCGWCGISSASKSGIIISIMPSHLPSGSRHASPFP